MHVLQLLGERAAATRRKKAMADALALLAQPDLEHRQMVSDRTKALGLAPPPEVRAANIELAWGSWRGVIGRQVAGMTVGAASTATLPPPAPHRAHLGPSTTDV